MQIRGAVAYELPQLARLWHDAWQDGHAGIVPGELARLRTVESFEERLRAALADIRVGGPIGAAVGFSVIKGDELYQLFVAAEARGSVVAAALIDDAEARLARNGIAVAWLACAIGNDRAARFYEKRGWRRTGVMVNPVETSEGVFPLEVWPYEKALAAA